MSLPKFAEVTWFDAHSNDSWDEELDTDARVCHTAGYLVKETDQVVVIASSIDQKTPVTYACVMTIPKVCVTSIKRFK